MEALIAIVRSGSPLAYATTPMAAGTDSAASTELPTVRSICCMKERSSVASCAMASAISRRAR